MSEPVRDSISIRRLPSEVWGQLTQMARRNGRSVESEAREALISWTGAKTDITARLNYALGEYNSIRYRSKQMTVSKIAEAIGEIDSTEAKGWFAGDKNPPFERLNVIATTLQVDPSWLKHGEGTPYKVHHYRLPSSLDEAFRQILELDDAGQTTLRRLIFIRAQNDVGNLAIVQEAGNYSSKVICTPYHVSEKEIGAGGESDLACLFLFLEFLRRAQSASLMGLSKCHILSMIVPAALFDELTSGHVSATARLQSSVSQPWWDDIWDENMFQNPQSMEYWSGFKALCRRIDYAIKSENWRLQLRNSIRDGSYRLFGPS